MLNNRIFLYFDNDLAEVRVKRSDLVVKFSFSKFFILYLYIKFGNQSPI